MSRIWVIECGDPLHGMGVFGVATDADRGDVVQQAMELQQRCHGGGSGDWARTRRADRRGVVEWWDGGSHCTATPFEIAL